MAVLAFKERSSNSENNEEWLITSQEIMPLNRPAHRSIILVHGFVGSPFDFKPVAEKLSNIGFRVVVPTVPGQTKNTLAYKRAEYKPEFYIEWLEDIIKDETKRFNKKPFLVGFSMGGTLSTILASKNLVDKLILISPFYSLAYANNMIWNFSRGIKLILPLVHKFSKGMINDPIGRKKYTPGSFIVSLEAFNHLERLAAYAKQLNTKITVPIMIIGSPYDQVASFAVTKKLYSSRPDVTIREYPDSNHILMYDYNCEDVVLDIIRFISECEEPSD